MAVERRSTARQSDNRTTKILAWLVGVAAIAVGNRRSDGENRAIGDRGLEQ